MGNMTRFELEEAIVAMSDICDNIELLQLDGPQDKILADIIACGLVHKLKFDRLWKVFVDVFDLQDGKASYTSSAEPDPDPWPPESQNPGCCNGGHRHVNLDHDPCEGMDGIW